MKTFSSVAGTALPEADSIPKNTRRLSGTEVAYPAPEAVLHPAPDRRNNFDALRLALAILVLFSHSYSLAGAVDPIVRLTRWQFDGGTIAVDGFFVISGYLITDSWLRSRSTDAFLAK